MVRAGATTPSKKKEKEAAAALTAEDKADEAESKRLRELAFSRRLISRSRSHAHHPSLPSKTILSSDGRDITKKGHRKSKYLFAFPGLLAPTAGGKLGELTNLDSKNPILYFEFPQGRLKLFGTITYPKNKYLTLHFPRGSGNILCEDCFESIIVFSQAWWIGTKEQNPEEVRLPLPKSFEQEENNEVDFTAGAGQGKDVNKNRHQLEKSEAIPQTSLAKPEVSEAESTGKESDGQVVRSVRQSARTAGKILTYADSSSESENSRSDKSQEILSDSEKNQLQETTKEHFEKRDTGGFIDIDDDTPKKRTLSSAKAIEKGISDSKTKPVASKSPLKATDGKSFVLKQSLIKFFCQLDSTLQEGSTPAASMGTTIDSKIEVTTAAVKSNIKSGKRSRNISEGHSKESDSDVGDNDIFVPEASPSKCRKLSKTDSGAGITKVSTPKRKFNSASKVQGQDLSVKKEGPQQKRTSKEKPSKAPSKEPASTTKAQKSALKSRKSYTQSSDTEDEEAESDDTNDDSDEDYVG